MATILLADAAWSVRQLARAVLERDSVTFIDATNAQEVWEAIALHRIDVIVIDVDLPPYGGQELLRGLREVVDVPVVTLAFRSTRLPGCVLLKPIDPWQLVEHVESALDDGEPQGDP